MLEVLKITEAEMKLRDQTREAEQARPALTDDEIDERTRPLADEQDDIILRTEIVIEKLEDLAEVEDEFGQEIEILGLAREAMMDAYAGLDATITGPETIAAETEAIENLLRSRRSGGSGGGGSGANPGGGGGGTDGEVVADGQGGPAMGVNEDVAERDVTRRDSRVLSRVPVELQEALDRYFDALEGGR